MFLRKKKESRVTLYNSVKVLKPQKSGITHHQASCGMTTICHSTLIKGTPLGFTEQPLRKQECSTVETNETNAKSMDRI